MFDPENFKKNLFFINDENFEASALELYRFQWENNPIYQQYCKIHHKNLSNVTSILQIPFLPIEFFKSHSIKTGNWIPEKTFQSSGTTSSNRSKHYIQDLAFYHLVTEKTFQLYYNSLNEYKVLALLPSYLEQGDSSLISMVDHFIKTSSKGGCFVKNPEELNDLLDPTAKNMIIGVSYALLDYAETTPDLESKNCIVMETGGMKGRRKEIIRDELHSILRQGLNVSEIHSEYGMTELQSQAYGINGCFSFPPWAKYMLRDINDPFTYVNGNRSGGINVIDLANIYSCAFIETKDLGRSTKNGLFEVLGRFDNADIRGCNLMV